MSDDELLTRWRTGDNAAGQELFDRYFQRLYAFFRSKLSRGIDDLVQKTFLACVTAKQRAGQLAGFRAFLYGVARNVLYKELRARSKDAQIDIGVTSVHDLDPSPFHVLAERDEQRLLLHALRRLPLDDQIAVELRYWEDASYEELSVVLDVAVPTARRRLQKARALLHTELTQLARSPELLASTQTDLAGWARSLREAIGTEEA